MKVFRWCVVGLLVAYALTVPAPRACVLVLIALVVKP